MPIPNQTSQAGSYRSCGRPGWLVTTTCLGNASPWSGARSPARSRPAAWAGPYCESEPVLLPPTRLSLNGGRLNVVVDGGPAAQPSHLRALARVTKRVAVLQMPLGHDSLDWLLPIAPQVEQLAVFDTCQDLSALQHFSRLQNLTLRFHPHAKTSPLKRQAATLREYSGPLVPSPGPRPRLTRADHPDARATTARRRHPSDGAPAAAAPAQCPQPRSHPRPGLHRHPHVAGDRRRQGTGPERRRRLHTPGQPRPVPAHPADLFR